jgi:hypothetical protein
VSAILVAEDALREAYGDELAQAFIGMAWDAGAQESPWVAFVVRMPLLRLTRDDLTRGLYPPYIEPSEPSVTVTPVGVAQVVDSLQKSTAPQRNREFIDELNRRTRIR